MNLHEDPNLQKLKTDIREMQCKYDEVRVTTRTLTLVQCLVRLQEKKKLQSQIKEL